jgi:hypothetical protein
MRGLGCTRAWTQCLDLALKDSASGNSEQFIMFMEDDGRLVNKDLCHKGYRSELWQSVPNDTFVLMLGGFGFVDTVKLPNSKFTYSSKSFGTMGFAITPTNIPALRDRWLYDIDHPEQIRHDNGDPRFTLVSPDLTWYEEARNRGERIYATNPHLIWHDDNFSNTWS